MKKLTKISFLIVIVLSLTMIFASCNKFEVTDRASNFEKGAAVKGLSAHELANAAFDYWENCENYQRVEYMDFKATAAGMTVATRFTKQIYKKTDGKIYSEKVNVNSGQAGTNDGEKFYFDGKDTYFSSIDKTQIPGKSSKEDEDALYSVKKWADLSKLTKAEDVTQKTKDHRKMITTYDISKKEHFTSDSDDTVYKFKGDPSLYVFTIVIDTSDEKLNSTQSVARDEFYGGVGYKENTLKITSAKITFLVEKDGDSYRPLKWLSEETTSGEHGALKGTTIQHYYATFSYDAKDYSISADATK